MTLRFPTAIVVTGVLLLRPALAEEPAAIEEIVVSAQRRTENLQDVPIAVSALSGSAIEERNIGTLNDVATQIPSFKFGEIAGAGQASIRGVGFSLVSGTGEGSVAVHTDGVFLARPGAATMLQQDLASIEVLRGPQGTLYGRNATGGVVNLVTPAPPEDFHFEVGAGGGSIGQRRASVSVGDSFLGGLIRGRVSFAYDHIDDYFENVEFPGRDQGGREQLGGRLSLDVEPADWLELQVRSFLVDEDLNGILYAAYKPPPDSILAPPGTFSDDPYEIRNNDAGVTTKTLRGGSLRAIVEPLGGLTITSITGYVEYGFVTRAYDGDGTSQNIFTVFRDEDAETWTEELIVRWAGGRFDWLGGLFYLRDSWTQTNDAIVDAGAVGSTAASFLLNRLLPGTDPLLLTTLENANIENDNREHSSSLSGFTDVTFSMLDWLRLYAGGRYIHEKKEHLLRSVTTVDTPAGPVTNVACDPSRQSFDVGTATGRSGIQADVSADMMTYVQVASGFKPGGFAIATCGDSFEAERVYAVELGWKSTWLDNRVRFNGGAFFYKYPDLQVEEIRFPEIEVNNADAEVRGVELEAEALLFDWLEASLNGTWLDAFYTRFMNSDNTASLTGGPVMDLSGNMLNRSPKFSGGAALQARRPIGGLGSLVARGETSFSTKYALREFNGPTDFQDAYAIGNFFLTWFSPAESVLVRGYVKNVADEPILQGLLGIAGYKAASFGMPRIMGVEARYRW